MLRKLLPVLLIIAGLGLGLGAGLFLRPAGTEPHSEDAAEGEPATAEEAGGHAGEAATEGSEGQPAHDYVKLNNQFIVPVVEKGRVSALVILSLSLEVATGSGEGVYAIEPKLRDALLQVMFDHANSGGFSGSFTDSANLVLLRKALLEAAMRVAGKGVSDVLIVDIVRQDS